MKRPELAVLNEDFPKARDAAANELSELLNYIIALLNIKVNDSDVDSMDEQILLVGDMIRTEFGFLTIPEVKRAFKMYVTRQLEGVKVFRILDCISAGEVLNAFVEFRNESLRVYSNKKSVKQSEMVLPQITESEKQEMVVKGIIRVFEDYKLNKAMPEPNAYIFDELYSRGLIREATTPALQMYYQKKYDQAKAEVEAELKTAPVNSPAELREIRAEIDKISGMQSSKVEVRTKRIILSEYFDKLISEGKEISEILKTKES